MHYYQFNIADYRKDTVHLTHEEHGIYRALLDQCYLDEQPLTLDIRALMRKLRLTSDQKETLELILGDFFKKTEKGYENNRVSAELQRLYDKSESARRSAKARWDANALDKDANAMRTHSERNANGMLPINPTPNNPITHKPKNPTPTKKEKTLVELKPDPAREVFEYWQEVMNHQKAAFDEKRKALIRKQLKNYTVDDLKKAIYGCSVTPHNMGDNDRGERYDSIELILREAKQIDRFMHNADHPPAGKIKTLDQTRTDAKAQSDRVKNAMGIQ